MPFQVFTQFYFLVQYVVIAILLFVIFAMTLRLIFNFADPNPFTQIGKFAQWLRDKTDSFVYPVAYWLGSRQFDKRFAPFITILLACLFAYFLLRIVGTVTMSLDGIILSGLNGRIVALIGFLLYGFLGLLGTAIFIRVVLSWFVVYGNKLTRFFTIVTDPILVPFRRLIPPLGGTIDISAILAMILIDLFQRGVYGSLIAPGA